MRHEPAAAGYRSSRQQAEAEAASRQQPHKTRKAPAHQERVPSRCFQFQLTSRYQALPCRLLRARLELGMASRTRT